MRLARFLAPLMAGLAFASAAMAGVPVDLRPQPTAEGSTVTLGDLFDGAGRAGKTPLVTAQPGAPSVVLDAGQVQRVAHMNGLDWDNPSGFRRVVVQLGAAPAPTGASPAAARNEKTVEVLTFTRSLAAGDVIQPSDVLWTKVQSHLAPSDTPADAAQVIGMTARRPLREGAAVSGHDLMSPIVIKRDQLVTVAYAVEGVELTVQGKAMADASAGQPVEVINTQSKKTIAAIATGPGRAVTGPGAEAYRVKSYAAR